ncbi:cytochrome P450 [Hyaloscypha variabilis F]|uniref:Cytochrome P450 n=1 Tax=Hyaloscypha variabilis (strain UAMH 11265 / GT02V1 / F) TaxID=1149755 RepID=A0A2J6R4S6_HYAVF|nr:cytochrome P450 [Hyaloscypha variabilis F]
MIGMRPADYPPGPPTLPLIGNLHQMPMSDIHLKLQEWAKKYGSIYSLKLGGQTLVVLSSAGAVKDLLEKRSGIYSARPDVFIREFGDDLNILMRTNDETWRRQRKMYHVRLNGRVADNYIPYQDLETKQLLADLLHQPDDFTYHVKRLTSSLASTIVYGWRTTSVDLPQVKKLFEWIDGYAVAAGRMQVMDWYPFLRPIFRRLPKSLSGIQDQIVYLKDLEHNLWMDLLKNAQENIKDGKLNPSFCRDMLLSKDSEKDGLTDVEIAFNAGHAWAGATDTTYNTTMGFIKAMILFPGVQKAAQKELDNVIGTERLPEWSDLDALPYIRSCVKEALRWMPTTITGGMPHCLTKDDKYMGYKIPAGAAILNNVWTLNNDDGRVRNSREYDPSRHFGDNTSSQESAVQADFNKRDHFTFGAGRRICPGLHVADRSLFLTFSRLLWAFDMEPEGELVGKVDPVLRDAVTPGFIVAPVPYKCKFTPRSEERAQKIRDIWAKSTCYLDKSGNYEEDFFSRHFSDWK